MVATRTTTSSSGANSLTQHIPSRSQSSPNLLPYYQLHSKHHHHSRQRRSERESGEVPNTTFLQHGPMLYLLYSFSALSVFHSTSIPIPRLSFPISWKLGARRQIVFWWIPERGDWTRPWDDKIPFPTKLYFLPLVHSCFKAKLKQKSSWLYVVHVHVFVYAWHKGTKNVETEELKQVFLFSFPFLYSLQPLLFLLNQK